MPRPGPDAAAAGRRYGPTPADWEAHKDEITDLYLVQGKTLKELMQVMETEHGFFASPKMYNNRFKWWGIGKNMRARTAVAIRSLQSQRDEAGRARSEYLVNGRPVTADRLERYFKRATASRVEKAQLQLQLQLRLAPPATTAPSSDSGYAIDSITTGSGRRAAAAAASGAAAPAVVVVRTPSSSPSLPLRPASPPPPLSPLETHRLSAPDDLQLPEDLLGAIRNFYAGYFEWRPATHRRSHGLEAFAPLRDRLVRFDSQYQALAYVLVEPPGEAMFRLLDCFYIEIRDQLREHDHFLLPMCLHNVYFLATDPRAAPFARLLSDYLREGSDIYLGAAHPLTAVWSRLADAWARDGRPWGREVFRLLGDYIDDRLRTELGEFNVLYLRIQHHFLWTYSGFEALASTIADQLARLDAIAACTLGPAWSSPSPSFPFPSLMSSSSPPPPAPPARRAIAAGGVVARDTSAAAAVHPADLRYVNEVKTILRGSLTFGLYVAGRHSAARDAALYALAGDAVHVLPGVKGCLHSVVGNVAFFDGDAAAAVAHARASLELSEEAGVSLVVVVARLSRLAVFLEAVGDLEGARATASRIAGLLACIGG